MNHQRFTPIISKNTVHSIAIKLENLIKTCFMQFLSTANSKCMSTVRCMLTVSFMSFFSNFIGYEGNFIGRMKY